eukprot:scaffold12298_cov66-Phaeocystis_antarctica.AAC.1
MEAPQPAWLTLYTADMSSLTRWALCSTPADARWQRPKTRGREQRHDRPWHAELEGGAARRLQHHGW